VFWYFTELASDYVVRILTNKLNFNLIFPRWIVCLADVVLLV